jgi:hypothetical protein
MYSPVTLPPKARICRLCGRLRRLLGCAGKGRESLWVGEGLVELGGCGAKFFRVRDGGGVDEVALEPDCDVVVGVEDGFAFACAAVVAGVGVAKPLEGFESGPCCRSLPCSVINAGPSLTSCLRSCGTIFDRTRSFTGCFELASE